MRILMLGINHRTCPVQLREKLAIINDRYTLATEKIRQAQANTESVILSTCNRTEIYVARPSRDPLDATILRQILSDVCDVTIEDVTTATIYREQQPAINHLFSVITGLDSMVIGETEILGQIKKAYQRAIKNQTLGPVLHKLFQEAITFSKKARLETSIDQGRVSIGSIVVDFAKQVFENFTDKTIVSIGAGEMVGTTLRHLLELEPQKIWIANRTQKNAIDLAHKINLSQEQGGARTLDDLEQLLIEADILLSCTGSSKLIVEHQNFKKILKSRKNRPLFIIDIAIPRDIDPQIGTMKNIYLYNIDDLHKIVNNTNQSRQEAVHACQQLLTKAVKKCYSQIQHRDVGVTIKQLRTKLFDLGDIENARSIKKLSNASPEEAENIIEQHTHRLINKILHMPLSQLDPKQTEAPLGFYAAALRRLFALDQSIQTEKISTSENSQATNSEHKIAQEFTEIQPIQGAHINPLLLKLAQDKLNRKNVQKNKKIELNEKKIEIS